MAIVVLGDDRFEINGKPIDKDTDGQWTAQHELTVSEQVQFYSYLRQHEVNKN